MKHFKTAFFALFILFIAGNALSAPYDYLNTEVTRWADPTREPLTYEEYIRDNPIQPFQFTLVSATDDTLPFVIIVNTTLYPQISASIDQYMSDLQAEDFAPVLYTAQGGTPQELKDDILRVEWELGAVGALLVGDLPVPWFELYEDFDNNSIPDDPWMVNFPCDLFYMDLNGGWWDFSMNGINDVHEGLWEPDIWIGRLTASTLQGSEAANINNYFAKNHAYREGTLTLPDRALAYIDDDWAGAAYEWGAAVAMTWETTDIVSEINTTTASDYMERWDDNYQHVLLCSHSSPTLHTLKQNNGQSWGYVYWNQISSGDPNFLFYNLFACSNCKFVENNYCGGVYIFNDTYGINAVGSAKTGAMLFFEDYYEPLGEGETFGESLIRWFALHGNEPGSIMWARSWFYGMTNLGDPTLRVIAAPELTITLTPENPPIQIPASGGVFDYNIAVANNGAVSATFDVWTMATLPNGDEYGPILDPLNLTFNAGYSANRDRSQSVPAGAPSGDYTYDAYIGYYPDDILAEDHFDFEKLAVSDGGAIVHDWDNLGESFYNVSGETMVETPAFLHPSSFILHPSSPNPFNPETVLSFELRAASFVELVVYDIQGREIARLVDGFQPARTYQRTFDGSQLASGVYFARLKAEGFQQTRKLLLVR